IAGRCPTGRGLCCGHAVGHGRSECRESTCRSARRRHGQRRAYGRSGGGQYRFTQTHQVWGGGEPCQPHFPRPIVHYRWPDSRLGGDPARDRAAWQAEEAGGGRGEGDSRADHPLRITRDWRGVWPLSPCEGRGACLPAAADPSPVYGARGRTRRAHRVQGAFHHAVSHRGRGALRPCRPPLEQSQDTAAGLQRGNDPWGPLCEGLAAPPGASSGLLCPFHLHTPRHRDVFPASPGVEFTWKWRRGLWILQLMKWSDARFDASIAATKPVVWTTLTWGLLVFAALLPIGLLSWYAW